jgi:hypothetical protein
MKLLLQHSRITVNFRLHQLDQTVLEKSQSELLNCFAFNQKPNEINHYNIGRDTNERFLFQLDHLANHPFANRGLSYGQWIGNGIYSRSASFDWHSRPCYGTLDFMNNRWGGAPTFGKSFLVFDSSINPGCTYYPVDLFQAQDWGFFSKIKKLFDRADRPHPRFSRFAIFDHFESLVANMQNDLLGYNALVSLVEKATGMSKGIHPSYGMSLNNYIDVQVYRSVFLEKDIKNIYLANDEVSQLKQKDRDSLLKFVYDKNKTKGYEWIVFN